VCERVLLRPELAAYETALRRRVGRLASMADPRLVQVRSVDRDPDTSRVAVVSQQVPGLRLSDLLHCAREHELVPDLTVALSLTAEILAAVHTFHALSGLPHGIVSADRVIVTPDGDAMLADHVYAEVIETARFSPQRLWAQFGVATWLGEPFSFEGDVRQAGLIAVGLMLGRPLDHDDLPAGLDALLAEVEEAADIRGGRLFADPVRAWLARALAGGTGHGFRAADEAAEACAALLTERERVDARPALLQFLDDISAPPPRPLPIPATYGASIEEPAGVVWNEPAAAAAAEDQAEPFEEAGVLFEADRSDVTQPAEEPFISSVVAEPFVEAPASEEPFEASVFEEPSFEPPETPFVPVATEPDPASAVHAAEEAESQSRALDAAPPLAAEAEPPRLEPEAAPPEWLETATPASISSEPAVTEKPEPFDEPEPIESPVRIQPPASVAEPDPIVAHAMAAAIVSAAPESAAPAVDEWPPPPTPVFEARTARAPDVVSGSPFAVLRGQGVPAPAAPSSALAPAAPSAPPQVPVAPRHVRLAPTPVEPPPPLVVPTAAPVLAEPEKPAIRLKQMPAPARSTNIFLQDDRPEPPRLRSDEPRVSGGGWKLVAAAAILLVAGLASAKVFWPGEEPAAAVVIAPGILVVETVPEGSEVFVNGRSRGLTPATLEVPPGRYTVKLAREGASHEWAVEVASGARRVERLNWAALQRTGGIEVVSNTEGAKVLVDGQPRGETPLTLTDLEPGRHTVVVQAPNGTVRRTVTVKAGETVTVDAAVYSGWLLVSAPIELQVLQKGRAIAIAGEGPIMLPAGRQAIELVNETLGYRASHDLDIKPGEEERLTVAPSATVNINALPWAEVWIDGVKMGETPLANVSVPLGTRDIIFRHPELGERTLPVTVKASGNAPLIVDFTK
jgi:hypothetical protein